MHTLAESLPSTADSTKPRRPLPKPAPPAPRNPRTDPRVGDQFRLEIADEIYHLRIVQVYRDYTGDTGDSASGAVHYLNRGRRYSVDMAKWAKISAFAEYDKDLMRDAALLPREEGGGSLTPHGPRTTVEPTRSKTAQDDQGEVDERAPAMMTPGEHEYLTRKVGHTRAAWAYYRTWLKRHRWFVEADTRGDLELLVVFEREMEKKQEDRRKEMIERANKERQGARAS